MSEYFLKPKSLSANVMVKLDLSYYGSKADLKNATGVDTSDVDKMTDLANLTPDVDKLDIDKLKNAPSNLSNLSNLKSKEDKLDVNKLVPALVELSKPNGVVKMLLLKRMYIMLRLKILKIKHLVLLNWLSMLLLMVK